MGAGQQAVSAPSFTTKVSEDLKQESVDITLAATSATIVEMEEKVVEEVLVDDSGSEVTLPKTAKPESPKQTSPKPASKKPVTTLKPASKKPVPTLKPGTPEPHEPTAEVIRLASKCCEHKGRCSQEMTRR